jgi:GNAT superfamily N-acetyltransferase
MIRVRRAQPSDVPTVAELLAEVFTDYPWMAWTVEATDRRTRLTALYRHVLDALVLPHGAAWVCESGHRDDLRLVGAAGWLTPRTQPPAATLQELAAAETHWRGNRREAHERAEALLQPLRPTRPCWFLGTLGVLPDHRGQGLAARLLRPGLESAAAEGVDAVLETSAPRNVTLYGRLGFDIAAAVKVAPDGPTVWSMRRRP